MIYISKNNIIVKGNEGVDFTKISRQSSISRLQSMGIIGQVFVSVWLSNADKVIRATTLILCQSREKYITNVFLAF